MDKNSKEKIAKTIVGIDDAIKHSSGLAELLGHIFAFFVAMSVGADLASKSADVSEDVEV